MAGYTGLSAIRYTPDGSKLIVRTFQHTRLYDVTGSHPIEKQVLKSGNDTSLDVSGDGSLLAIVDTGKVLVWDISKEKSEKIAEEADSIFAAVAISPDGQRIAAADASEPKLALWALEGSKLDKVIEWSTDSGHQPDEIRFSPDGKSLFTKSIRQPKILVWDVSSAPNLDPSEIGTIPFSQTFSTGDSHVAVGDGNTVRIWQYVDELSEIPHSIERPNAFSDVWYANGSRLLAVTHEKIEARVLPTRQPLQASKSVVLDLKNGNRVSPRRHEPIKGTADLRYHRVAEQYSPDGRRKAQLMQAMIPDGDNPPGLRGYARIFSHFQEDKDLFPSSIVLNGIFSSMAWSNDGKQLVTGSEGKLQLWDSITGDLIDETTVDGKSSAMRFLQNSILAVQQEQNELADYDKHLVVWNVGDDVQDVTTTIPISDRSKIDQARISKNADVIALRKRRGPIRIYHFDGEQLYSPSELKVEAQYFMDDFSPDGKLLSLRTWGAGKDLVGLFDTRTGNIVQEWKPPGQVRKVRFSPDGAELALANGNGTVYVLDVPPAPEVDVDFKSVQEETLVEFKPPDDDATLRAQFDKLKSGFDDARKKWSDPPNNRKGEPPFLRYAEPFMELGNSAPETASGRDALVQVCRSSLIAGYQEQNRKIVKLQSAASRLLLKHHFLDPEILPVIEEICYRSNDVRGNARRLIRESPDRRVQARASLVLARNYEGQLRSGFNTSASDAGVVVDLYQRIIDNYEALHMWEGGPSYRSIAEKVIKRLKK